MISVHDALEKVLNGILPLPAEQVALSDTLGRVLAEDITARITQPPIAVCAMDGYAVRSLDLQSAPVMLELIGEVPTGNLFKGHVGPGQCVRIFTGGAMPDGTDAVEMQENTNVDRQKIVFNRTIPTGHFVRPAGLDFAKGEILLKAGHLMTARDVSLAAAMNVPWMRVARRPVVAMMTAGDELVMPGEFLSPGKIINSNSLALRSYITVLGGIALDLGTAKDKPGALTALLAGTQKADLLVTIGGASVGDYDYVKDDLGKGGINLGFHKVAMRPGKPLIFGYIDTTPVLGLPGNPVSVGVTSILFLQPIMRKMLGLDPICTTRTAILDRNLPANDWRQSYLRATLSYNAEDELVVTPFKIQDSAIIHHFAQADCLLIRLPHAPKAQKGEQVEIIPLKRSLLSL